MRKRSLTARVCAGVVCVSVATSMSPVAGIALAVTQGETAGLYGVSTLSGESDEGKAATSAEEEQFDLSLLGSDEWSTLWLDEDLSKPNIGQHYFANDDLGIGRSLTQGKDFEVVGWCASGSEHTPLGQAPTSSGYYSLKVKGIGSYKGESYAGVDLKNPSDVSHYYANVTGSVWLDDLNIPTVDVFRTKNGERISLPNDAFSIDGWYTFGYSSNGFSYEKVEGLPTSTGNYYLRVSGNSPSYSGEDYVGVTIRDKHDLSSCWGYATETLWLDNLPDLESLPLTVCRWSDSGDPIALEKGTDYAVAGWHSLVDGQYVSLGTAPSEAGTYYLKVESAGSYHGSLFAQVTVRDRRDLSEYWGYSKEVLWLDNLPDLENLPLDVYRWFDNGDRVALERGTDYTVAGWYTYDSEAAGDHYVQMPEAPAEQGTYFVRVEGAGSYHGSAYFSVDVKDRYLLSNCWASFDEQLWTDGDLALENLPLRVCTEDRDPIENYTLEQGKHYTVSGWYTYVDGEAGQPITGNPTTTGTYCLKLQGISPYKGEKVVSVRVRGAYDLSEYYASSSKSLWLDDLDCSGVGLYRVMGGEHYELARGTDYTLSGWYTRSGSTYSLLEGAPKATGEYWLKAEGTGSYSGEQYVPVSVWDRYDLSSYRISTRGELWDDSDMSAYPSLYVRTPDYERAQDVTYGIDGWFVKEGNSYSALEGAPSSPGNYYLKITGNGLFHGSTYAWVNLRDSKDISNYYVACKRSLWLDDNLAPSSLSVQVRRDLADTEERVFLTRDRDYSVEGWYFRNSEGGYALLEGSPASAGTYYLKVEGKQPFSGKEYVSVEVKDRYTISSYEIYSNNLWDDSDFSNTAAFIEEYDGELSIGEEISASGWYTRGENGYTSLNGMPTAAGEYYLRVEGVLPYIGEEYVHVNVRDSHDVGSYWGRSNEILWTDSDLDISSLDLDVRRYECTKQKETHLTQGEDFKAIGWYTYDYDEDNEPLEEAPKDPGEYIVKVKGTGNEYSGELNVLVEVRDPSDIGGYVAEISGNLTLGTDLSDPELSVYRVNPKTKQNEYLAKGRDFEVVGWHEYDSDETVESPTAQGDWSLVLKGKGDYKGTQYIWVDLAEPGASGGSSGGGGGSTAPTTPPATGTEVGEKAEGVVIGGGAGGDEGGSTTADVTVTGTTPATDSQGNAVDGTVSIGNISSSEGTVVIPETVTVEGKTYLVTEIPAGAMKGSETATSVTIPASVTAIGEGAFENCTSLTSVTIPAGVTEIQSSTFSGCTSLQSVEIEGDVTSIASSAFAGCESLSSVEIPATVTTIGEGAFTGCESLTSVSIPEGSTVGAGAFAGSGLTSVTIPAGVELGTRAFQDCEDLKSVTVEKGVESLPAYAFKGCTSLKSVTIKSGVTAIERSAFSGCTSLKSLTLPKGVESIGKYALYGASKVKTLTINSKDLTKASVKGSLKGSSVTTVLVPKSMVSKYAKVFSKANCGRKVVVKAIKKRG